MTELSEATKQMILDLLLEVERDIAAMRDELHQDFTGINATLDRIEAIYNQMNWVVDKELYDRWFDAEVEMGLAEADAGETIPHEQVVAELRAAAAARQKARVEHAMNSTKPRVPHEQVMREARAIIDAEKERKE